MSKENDTLGFEQEYIGSSANVIKSVLLGKADAGAILSAELEKEPEENRRQVRVLIETPAISPHPLCAHPRVPKAVQRAVKEASLAAAGTKEGAELLKSVRLAAPVAADYAKDYGPLESIDVMRLSNWGR